MVAIKKITRAIEGFEPATAARILNYVWLRTQEKLGQAPGSQERVQ